MTRGSGDHAVVERHLAALDSALTHLRGWTGTSLEELRTDQRLQWAVLHGLQVCAQNVLDIATHLAAAAGRDAADYSSAIDRLAELGVLTPAFASSLRPLAGFRNVLVHGYLGVDLAIVHGVLTSKLEDFARFAEAVRSHLRAS
ncbi:MAG: DUF86 domain-containing protein [Myxococcota bacterium]